MTSIREIIAEASPEALLADGFDEAIIGYDSQGCCCYDHDKCVDLLMRETGMPWEDVEEHMQFNVTGAHFGDMTPRFVYLRKSM